jgi:hypothetical protein
MDMLFTGWDLNVVEGFMRVLWYLAFNYLHHFCIGSFLKPLLYKGSEKSMDKKVLVKVVCLLLKMRLLEGAFNVALVCRFRCFFHEHRGIPFRLKG